MMSKMIMDGGNAKPMLPSSRLRRWSGIAGAIVRSCGWLSKERFVNVRSRFALTASKDVGRDKSCEARGIVRFR
jgi:hypothetical protein